MPPDPENRAELLERIITTGTKRRRRRRAMLGGALVALVAIVAVPLAWPDDGDRDEVTVVDDPDESTTTLSSTSSSTSSSTTSTTAAPVVETTLATTPVEETTTTTEEPPVCRNSYDPRCGDFYWDYPATFANQPLTISIAHEPAIIIAGQDVVFHVTFHDPDAPRPSNCATGNAPGTDLSNLYFECSMPSCPMRPSDAPEPHGPWDPPPAQTHAPVTESVTVRYWDPGEYSVTVEGRTFAFCGDFFSGYASEATASITVNVLAA